MRKVLMYGKSNLGYLGEKSDEKIKNSFLEGEYLRVGDVIAFEKYDTLYVKPVVKSRYGEYGVFGFGSDNFDFSNITKILSYEFLTEELFQKLQGGRGKEGFSIKEVEDLKEMTLNEIEELLGHKIKIINR